VLRWGQIFDTRNLFSPMPPDMHPMHKCQPLHASSNVGRETSACSALTTFRPVQIWQKGARSEARTRVAVSAQTPRRAPRPRRGGCR
jgi:hypothetical protein